MQERPLQADAREPIRVGLSLMIEDDFRLAALPLFAEGVVEVLEWSFDTVWEHGDGRPARPMPAWAEALLDHYASEGQLLGHGVHFSMLSAVFEERQARWLEDLARETARRPYRRISEHYGFMTTPSFARGAPLPMPRSDAMMRIGRDRLARIRAALSAPCPIGIENLALAWSRDEALAHGRVLADLLGDRDGDGASDFIVFDVHNAYCQIVNFGLEAEALLASYPADRVRQIHVSGGSDRPAWPPIASSLPKESDVVRRDTHDERVPGPVFALLEASLRRFANVDVVTLERLGGTIATDDAAEQLRADYLRVREICAQAKRSFVERAEPSTRALAKAEAESGATESELAALQDALLTLLLDPSLDEATLRARLCADPVFAPLLAIDPDRRSLGISEQIVKRWTRRSAPRRFG